MKSPHLTIRSVSALLLGCAVFLASPLSAQTSYWGSKNWDFVCGGNEYYGGNFLELCSSVHMSVTDHPTEAGVSLVTMDVWNLSELAGPYQGSGTAVFTKVAFFNAGPGLTVLDTQATMWGGMQAKEKGGKLENPSEWEVAGTNSGANAFNNSGGVAVDFGGTTDKGVKSGIASGCTESGIRPVWYSGTQNECFENGDALTNAVTIQFRIADFAFNFNELGLAIHAQNMGPNGEYSSTLISPPVDVLEPTSWVLLAGGLFGLGIVAWRRRETEVDADGRPTLA